MPTAVAHIKQFDADVVILIDAYSLDNDLHASNAESLHQAHLHLATLGYARLRSISRRLVEMAHGECLGVLTENENFRDADRLHRPTFPARLPVLQLDHLVVSRQVSVEQSKVSEYSPVSDHRAILARMII